MKCFLRLLFATEVTTVFDISYDRELLIVFSEMFSSTPKVLNELLTVENNSLQHPSIMTNGKEPSSDVFKAMNDLAESPTGETSRSLDLRVISLSFIRFKTMFNANDRLFVTERRRGVEPD